MIAPAPFLVLPLLTDYFYFSDYFLGSFTFLIIGCYLLVGTESLSESDSSESSSSDSSSESSSSVYLAVIIFLLFFPYLSPDFRDFLFDLASGTLLEIWPPWGPGYRPLAGTVAFYCSIPLREDDRALILKPSYCWWRFTSLGELFGGALGFLLPLWLF